MRKARRVRRLVVQHEAPQGRKTRCRDVSAIRHPGRPDFDQAEQRSPARTIREEGERVEGRSLLRTWMSSRSGANDARHPRRSSEHRPQLCRTTRPPACSGAAPGSPRVGRTGIPRSALCQWSLKSETYRTPLGRESCCAATCGQGADNGLDGVRTNRDLLTRAALVGFGAPHEDAETSAGDDFHAVEGGSASLLGRYAAPKPMCSRARSRAASADVGRCGSRGSRAAPSSRPRAAVGPHWRAPAIPGLRRAAGPARPRPGEERRASSWPRLSGAHAGSPCPPPGSRPGRRTRGSAPAGRRGQANPISLAAAAVARGS